MARFEFFGDESTGGGGLHTVDRSANKATRLGMMGTPSGGENLPKASDSDSVHVNSLIEANRWRMQRPKKENLTTNTEAQKPATVLIASSIHFRMQRNQGLRRCGGFLTP